MIVNLPKLGPVQFDDNLSSDQVRQQIDLLAKKYDFQLPKPEVGIGTLLGRGFMRSMGETGIALGDVLPAMAGSFFGFEDYAKQQMAEAAASREELEKKYPTQFKSYKEIRSPYQALQYGAETLGELAPTALTALIPGVGAETLGARFAGQAAMREALAAGPLSRAGLAAAETAAKEAATTGGKRAMYGGLYLGSLAQNAPEVFENIYQETNKMEPGIAALAGGISAVLDTIVPGQMLGNLGKYGKLKAVEKIAKDTGAAPSVWKYIGKEAALSAASEGLTETAQEAIGAMAEQVAGSTKDFFSPENFDRFAESFVKGAIGGGAFGVIGGAGAGVSAKQEYRARKAEEDRLKGVRTGSAFDTLSKEEQDVGEAVPPAGGAGAGMAGVPGAGSAAQGAPGAPPAGVVSTDADVGKPPGRKGPAPAPVDIGLMTDEEKAAHFTDLADQYKGIHGQLMQLFARQDLTGGQTEMIERLGSDLNNLIDANADNIARASGDAELADKLKSPFYNGVADLDKLQTKAEKKAGIPRAAQQKDMFGSEEGAGRRAEAALKMAGGDINKAIQLLEESRQRLLARKEAGALDENWAISTHSNMPAGEAAKNYQALAEQHVQRTMGTIDAAIELIKQRGRAEPRAAQQESLFGEEEEDRRVNEIVQQMEEKRLGRKKRKEEPVTSAEDQTHLRFGRVQEKTEAVSEAAAEEKPEEPKREGVPPPERVQAPDVSTEHVAQTDEGRVLAGFFDLISSAGATDQEREKHQSAKNTAASTFLNYDLAEPGQKTSPGARIALNYLARLVGGTEKLQSLMQRLEGKSPETQAEILRSAGLPDLTSRRGMEAFSHRVQGYFENLGAPEGGGITIATRQQRMPATGEFKGIAPYSEEVTINTRHSQEYPTPKGGKPRRPNVGAKEKLYNLAVHGLRQGVRIIRQTLDYGGKLSPQQAAAKTYLDSQHRSTFGQALADLAYDLAYFEMDPRNHGANSTFYGEGGRHALNFKQWIRENLDPETNKALDEMVEDFKNNYIEEQRAASAISAYQREIEKYNKERHELSELGRTQIRTKLSEAIPETEKVKREKTPKVSDLKKNLPKQQMLVEIHPAILRTLEKGDVQGALKLLAEAKDNPFFSALAERLLESGVTAKSELIDANSVLPLSGDMADKQTLDAQLSTIAEAVKALVPADQHAQYLPLLQSNNLRDLEIAVNMLEGVFRTANPAQQEVFEMFKGFYFDQFAWLAKYDPNTDVIMIRRSIGTTNRVFLHEVVHAATLHLIDDPDSLTGVRRQGYDQLVKLYDFAKAALAEEEKRTGKIYGLKNLHEFVSEALTDPEFQETLRALAYEGTPVSLWNRFTQAVAKLFNVKPGRQTNVMVEVMRAADAMIASPVSLEPNVSLAESTTASPEGKERFAKEQSFYTNLREQTKEQRAEEQAKRHAEMRQKPQAARVQRGRPLPQGLPTQKTDIKRLMTAQSWDQIKTELPRIISSMAANARPFLLGTLTLRQIADLVNNRIPQINNFIRVAENFLARKNAILKEASDIASRWERLQARDPQMSTEIGRVMHMATIAEVDPDKATLKQRNAEPDLMTAWRGLNPEAKQIYRDVRNFYERRYSEYKRVMMKRIVQMRQLGVSEATITELRNEFERGSMKGPYFPLMRYGRFWYQIGTGANREYYMFESLGQRDAHRDERVKRNPELESTIQEGEQYQQQMDLHARESNFLKAAFESIDDMAMKGLDDASALKRKQDLKDTMYQTYLAHQPERSFRRQFMHRNNIEGFSQDALRNLATSSFHMAYQLSRFEHSPELFSQLDAARTQLKNRIKDTGYDPAVSKENALLSYYVEEVGKRLDMMLNPTDVGTIPSLLSNVGFIYYLTSVASAVTNVLGGAIIGLPTLVGQYVRLNPNASYTTATLEALKQVKNVVGQIMATGFDVDTGGPAGPGLKGAARKAMEFRLHLPSLSRSTTMSAVDRAAYEKFVADGLIDITQTYDISGLAATPTQQYGGVAHRAMSLLSYLFHNAERFNREVTAMSAFRTAMEKREGMTNRQQAFAESIAEAKDVTNRSMFDYSSTNKPRFFQNPVARTVLQFKQFPQQMTYFLTKSLVDSLRGASPEIRREARARFVGIMGMAGIFSGATGLWGFSTVAAIINAVVNGLGDDDEEPFDFELAFMQWASETFGKQLGTLLTRGIGNAVGVDLASRVKLDDMWFRDGRENQDEEEAVKSFLVDLLGPTIGLAPTAARAVKLWNQGHGDRALETIMPGFIKQPLIAYRYSKEGVQTLQGEVMVEDVGPFSLLMQSLGLRPSEVAELQLYNIKIKGQEQKVLKKRQQLLNLYGVAFISGDSDATDKAMDKIDEFNDEHGSVRIPMDSITRSVKEKLKKSSQTDHGLYIDKRLRGTLDRYDYAKA